MGTQKIGEEVSVNLVFDHAKKRAVPKWVVWNRRLYPITKIGLHHAYTKGATLYHVFSVLTKTLFMRLVFDTGNLHWTLEEIADAA